MTARTHFRVSAHAAARWIERVRPGIDVDQAVLEIRRHARAIQAVVAFGTGTVKLGCGARLIVRDACVTTVLGRAEGFAQFACFKAEQSE